MPIITTESGYGNKDIRYIHFQKCMLKHFVSEQNRGNYGIFCISNSSMFMKSIDRIDIAV